MTEMNNLKLNMFEIIKKKDEKMLHMNRWNSYSAEKHADYNALLSVLRGLTSEDCLCFWFSDLVFIYRKWQNYPEG